MFKHYFEGIENVEVGPIIGLVIFFIFFIYIVYQVVVASKGYISKMGNMPLDDNSDEPQEKKSTT
ncbi:MAG: cytochrome C oxidase Cbb3 [Bacteroidota bacterium]